MRAVVILGMALSICLMEPANAVANPAAAKVIVMDGKVLAIVPGTAARKLAPNVDLFAGETVATIGKAHALVVFSDLSKYELGPNSRLKIEAYRFAEEATDNISVSRVLTGFFRFVSGQIAHRNPRQVSLLTSVATIGIRGTHVVGEVTETSAKIGLLEPEEGNAPSSIEVSNAYGSVTINQPGYGTEIPDAHSPPSPPRPMDLHTMTRNFRAVQTMRRAIAPRLPPRMP